MRKDLSMVKTAHRLLQLLAPVFLFGIWPPLPPASGPDLRIPINVQPEDVLPTGNQWISLPGIRAANGALTRFNAISVRSRGLVHQTGPNGGPVLEPYLIDGEKPLEFRIPAWELIEYWIPTAHFAVERLDITLTRCASPDARGISSNDPDESTHCPGAVGPILASAADGRKFVFTGIPPGSLMNLPALGFIPESDPVFVRTYKWLHSKNYQYSYWDKPCGLLGSYRLPFTTSWGQRGSSLFIVGARAGCESSRRQRMGQRNHHRRRQR